MATETGWIQTFTGRRFEPLWPGRSEIVLEDIAHALSLQCRFGGHVRDFYSVAQHCVLASYMVPPEAGQWALLHDAAEAYLVDVPRPVKHQAFMAPYRAQEGALQVAIYQHFGLSGAEPDSVGEADRLLMALEARALLAPLHPDWPAAVRELPANASAIKVIPWPPVAAERKFLARFRELTGR